jgi:hypothetical protein
MRVFDGINNQVEFGNEELNEKKIVGLRMTSNGKINKNYSNKESVRNERIANEILKDARK